MSQSKKILRLFGGASSQEREDLEAERDITDDVIEADFVPYACLFDPHSIATKNGELLQIIRLSGINAEGSQIEDLRSVLRQALARHIPNTHYALWMHTIRRRAPLLPPDQYPDDSSQSIDAHWRSAHALDEYYINELYLTVVRAGDLTGPEADKKREFVRSLSPQRDIKLRCTVMESARVELEQTVSNMMADLQHYGAHRLDIAERDGSLYGEHLEFLEQLINLESRPMPIPQEDLSEYLTSGDVTFGFNAMEVRTAEGKRRFAAILTIKEYKEVSLTGLDQFLEIPCELIVTQCFDFIGAHEARAEYQKQAQYMTLSGDVEMAQWSELSELTRDDGLGERAFGQQQTSLFMIAPSIKQLETNIHKVRRALRRLGIVSVREDLRFEEMYWAQLPANFLFIARHNSVNTMHLAGFVKLARPPIGSKKPSSWGQPLIIFRNAQNMPCFFSFFDGPCPHAVIVGKRGRGRASFTHTLLSHTRKWPKSRIWMIDTQSRSTPFMEAIGAKILRLGQDGAAINPFRQENTSANIEFCALWVANLMHVSGNAFTTATIKLCQSAIATLMELPEAQRTLEQCAVILGEQSPETAALLAPYLKEGSHAHLFRDPNDSIQPEGSFSIDMAEQYADIPSRMAIASYALHRMTAALDGTPTIIVLDEGFQLLKNPIFGPRAAAWMEYVQSKNAMVLIGTSDISASAETNLVPSIMSAVGHKFLFSDHTPERAYVEQFGLSEEAYSILPEFEGNSRMVLHIDHQEHMQLYRTQMPMGEALHLLLSGKAPPKPKRNADDVMSELMGDTG